MDRPRLRSCGRNCMPWFRFEWLLLQQGGKHWHSSAFHPSVPFCSRWRAAPAEEEVAGRCACELQARMATGGNRDHGQRSIRDGRALNPSRAWVSVWHDRRRDGPRSSTCVQLPAALAHEHTPLPSEPARANAAAGGRDPCRLVEIRAPRPKFPLPSSAGSPPPHPSPALGHTGAIWR